MFWSYKATVFQLHFGIGVFMWICCIYSEHFFLRTLLEGYFWTTFIDSLFRLNFAFSYNKFRGYALKPVDIVLK